MINKLIFMLLVLVSLACSKKYKMPDSFYDLSSNQISAYTLPPSSSGLIQWEGRGAEYHPLKVDSIPDHLPWDTIPPGNNSLLQDPSQWSLPRGTVIKIYEFPKPDWEDEEDWESIRDTVVFGYRCPLKTRADSLYSYIGTDTTQCPGEVIKDTTQVARLDSVYAKAIVWMHGQYVQITNMKILVRINQSSSYPYWSNNPAPLYGKIPYRRTEEIGKIVYLFNNRPVKFNYIDRILETYEPRHE